MDEIRKERMRQFLGKKVSIVIDRPMGSAHPEHPHMIYPVNYGYLPDIVGGDGEAQDVYLLGVHKPVLTYDAIVISVIFRMDDNEDKLVAAPVGMTFSKDDIRDITAFQEQYFQIEIEMIDGGCR